MYRVFRRLRGRFETAILSDTAFIEAAYVEILGRPADEDGLTHYRALLGQGLGRTAVLLSLMRSEEFRRTLAPAAAPALPDLRASRPERYRQQTDLTNGETIWTFEAASADDFDWLERAILANGYYEKPGVWNFGIDTDKKVIADIIAAFRPRRALELGCAAGAVLDCLEDLGVCAEGIEISRMAIGRATERIRSRIHEGDLMTLALASTYDVIFGLDVFEHLNPNRLATYIARIAELIESDGYVFCNIPAFDRDLAFGTVFPLYLAAWAQERTTGAFRTLHVDDAGYPIHGHLVWGTAEWWVRQFEAQGLRREPAIEAALHRKYDGYFEKRSPARKAFFVFSKHGSPKRASAVVQSIAGP